jgi:tetratricopeptide (TPR) repeat protein
MTSIVVLIAVLTAGSHAQAPGNTPMSAAEIQKEGGEADALYKAQNMVGAAPLYEDLLKQQPQSVVWKERLAMSLLGVSATQDGEQKVATMERVHKLLLEAKAAGDNSPLLQVVLEKMDAAAQLSSVSPSPGMAAFQKAEKAFSSGQLPDALKFYEQAATADPKMYDAPLYAGDTEFKMGDCVAADRWYAQAAAINPDRETAHRYWGDCLMKQGEQAEAESQFIEALLAEPYSQATRLSLKKWADGNHARIVPPPILLPARPTTDGKGNTNITIDASTLENPASSAWLIYSMNPTVWRDTKFKEHYPTETKYRHSLAEEVDGLRGVLEVVKEQKIPDRKLDATMKSLKDLDADGMLECWVLLDNPDQGIAQDYVAYRASHHALMHAYIAKYDVHPF